MTLGGAGTDPDAGDADTLTHAWTKTAGLAVILRNIAAATATFDARAGLTEPETFTFSLRVTDAGGLYGEDTVRVTVRAGGVAPAAWGERLEDRDVALPAGSRPSALWSDGMTRRASDYQGGVGAYRLSDGTRLEAEDVPGDVLSAAGNDIPTGL